MFHPTRARNTIDNADSPFHYYLLLSPQLLQAGLQINKYYIMSLQLSRRLPVFSGSDHDEEGCTMWPELSQKNFYPNNSVHTDTDTDTDIGHLKIKSSGGRLPTLMKRWTIILYKMQKNDNDIKDLWVADYYITTLSWINSKTLYSTMIIII